MPVVIGSAQIIEALLGVPVEFVGAERDPAEARGGFQLDLDAEFASAGSDGFRQDAEKRLPVVTHHRARRTVHSAALHECRQLFSRVIRRVGRGEILRETRAGNGEECSESQKRQR
ncbi:hypothetical protein SDC9_131225 [bioreactor metagenome]|uniref:Uncharacterized protein n=1 Tax=bioreactor metagenome TaxID=1076179 RepID=A0A645D4A2_9ZZZZ